MVRIIGRDGEYVTSRGRGAVLPNATLRGIVKNETDSGLRVIRDSPR